jgi:hypothetical protein
MGWRGRHAWRDWAFFPGLRHGLRRGLVADQPGDGFERVFRIRLLVPVVNYRMNSFGLSLVPFIMGIGFLFFNAKSPTGWVLTVGGLTIILAGILMSLHIYFQPTSLFNTLAMLVLLFGGLGLVLRSLKAVPAVPGEGAPKAAPDVKP